MPLLIKGSNLFIYLKKNQNQCKFLKSVNIENQSSIKVVAAT